LETLRGELVERGINPATYQQHLETVEGTLALQLHGGKWETIKNRFTPEVMAVLTLLPEWLPESEPKSAPKIFRRSSIRSRTGNRRFGQVDCRTLRRPFSFINLN